MQGIRCKKSNKEKNSNSEVGGMVATYDGPRSLIGGHLGPV